MGKLNKTFQRLRRERRMNFSDISQKCKIPIERIKELDDEAEFANIELVSICEALGISISDFIKESDATSLDSPYLIKVKIKGNPEDSELLEAIRDVESERMNNKYSPECLGWKHNSFNEAVVVLENARNWLGCTSYMPPMYRRDGYLFAVLTHIEDHAYIDGKYTIGISFGPEDDLYDSMDLMDDPFDDMDDFRDFDNDLY